jgi:hypothetical protein
MNRCDSNGWLIANRPLPDDPVDYDLPKLPKIGCTRIRCSSCGAVVRSAAGFAMKEPGTKIQLVGLDPTTSPLFKPDSAVRFYFCDCLYHTEGGQLALYEPDGSFANQATQNWACAGHPTAGLPHDFDGAHVTTDKLDELVDKALHGWVPGRARDEDKPRTIWLARLHGRLAQTPHADQLATLVAAAIDHDDPMVRARALHFFIARPGAAAGAARALELLRGDRAKFAGKPDKITKIIGDSTLEHALWRVAAPLVAQGPARDLARKEALALNKGSQALYDALGAGDAAWLVANAAAVAKASPSRADDLVDTFELKLADGVDGRDAVKAVRAAV